MIFGNLGQKKVCWGAKRRPARNPKLPRDNMGYGDNIITLEKSVGVQKMEVYGWSSKNDFFLAKKMGLNPAQELSAQSFQRNKVPINLILITVWGEITFGLIHSH